MTSWLGISRPQYLTLLTSSAHMRNIISNRRKYWNLSLLLFKNPRFLSINPRMRRGKMEMRHIMRLITIITFTGMSLYLRRRIMKQSRVINCY